MALDPETEKVLEQVRSSEAQSALARWATARSTELILADWSAEGFSSAQLLGVYAATPGEQARSMIIKISSGKRGDREEKAHRDAWRDALPVFAPRHMAQLVENPIPVAGGRWISFQQVAGGGFKELAEFDKALPHWDEPSSVCSRILDSLSREWNTDSKPRRASVRSLLTELLDQRLQPRGTIRAWAAKHQGLLDMPRPWLDHGGAELFNPFALLGKDSPGGRVELIVLRGKSHGDLHPGNLLAGREPAKDHPNYCLVDLSRYQQQGLLAWDPVYLMLTTVAKHLVAGNVERESREALRQWLVHPGLAVQSLGRRELRLVINGINQAESDLVSNHGMAREWRSQRLLCTIAAALILTGRNRLLPADEREWFFWLAATAATELMRGKDVGPHENPLRFPDRLMSDGELFRLDTHRHGPQPDPSAPAAPAVHQDEAWSRLAEELRSVELNASDRSTLIARTEALRQLLEEPRGEPSADGERVEMFLGQLTRTLSDALRPGMPDAHARKVGAHADLLRRWLVELLT